MLLIFVPKLTNRAGYTINVVMRDYLQTDFAITTDARAFQSHEGARLCYASKPVDGCDAPFVKAAKILFETSIEEQECHVFDYEGIPAMFPVYGRDTVLPFDPFASIFFMLSRYEEYLPHRKDSHGRFLASESLAFRKGFLQTAVVDRWALLLRDILSRRYPELVFRNRSYLFEQTVDIDAAYCYRHKGIFRTVMGVLRDGIHRHDLDEVKHRLRVLRKKEEDPFDTFDYILNLSQQYSYRNNLIFFPLMGDYGIYDKPASPYCNEFRQLLQHLADYAKMGVHGSYYSADEPDRLEREIERLSDILHRSIVRNRFHFLRFNLPYAYRNLVQHDIVHDYSMGFAELPGFRCGTCTTVPFFDLNSDQESTLTMHPFMAMDTTFHTHMGISPDEAKAQLHALVDEVRAVDGTFSCIFHNQNLSDQFEWKGWRSVYEDLLEYGTRQSNT
jgi:hypothetical protein